MRSIICQEVFQIFIVLLSVLPTTIHTFKLVWHVMGGAIIVMNVKRNPFFIDQFFLPLYGSYRTQFFVHKIWSKSYDSVTLFYLNILNWLRNYVDIYSFYIFIDVLLFSNIKPLSSSKRENVAYLSSNSSISSIGDGFIFCSCLQFVWNGNGNNLEIHKYNIVHSTKQNFYMNTL